MKKTITSTFLFVFLAGLFTVSTAQTALDPNQFVNTQITASGVYTAAAGQYYAFDGRIDLTFDVTILGPDSGWIMNAANPPVFVNTPAADGSARTFFEVKAGGSLTLKNVLFSGTNSNGQISGNFAANTGGNKLIADNCAFTDWVDFALRNQFKGDSLLVTNCVFINGVRLLYNPFGGFPLRMDVACNNVVLENNSVVNSGRLTGNSGPWHNANIHEMHNTYVNQTISGHEQRANEMITANNIYYNFHFIGRKTEFHSSPSNTYDGYFTTWNYFADSKNKLDSISLYLGQNLFYREQKILDWFTAFGGDSLAPSLLWEHADVDSFITTDNNYTIGTNYAGQDPGFTVHPGNTDSIVSYIKSHWLNPTGTWPDWRITSPISFDGGGLPVLSWPPAFDLSYSNVYMQTAGTDGLPLGDLNWFPDQKADFLTNRADIIAALRDSMVNAVAVYDPTTMDNTPMITPWATAIEKVLPKQIYAMSNYPNPFNQTTTIQFGLLQPAKSVTLSVSNLFGQKVFEQTESRLPLGEHEITFDASNLSSGIYIYQIHAIGIDGQNYVASKRMILAK
ncbi:MAG: T9SS type A sorting domain-containing protein [Bacteroidia bacterium]|nr:T9SS type A sorting domain-containing protein [Bacteroidia bacterium]